ncbi:hypothetical protein HOY82DRAFT_333678 [Tuber indicum]|nr:hypothetical protein HOY82DRAFT_333678 [Tuber indicum]
MGNDTGRQREKAENILVHCHPPCSYNPHPERWACLTSQGFFYSCPCHWSLSSDYIIRASFAAPRNRVTGVSIVAGHTSTTSVMGGESAVTVVLTMVFTNEGIFVVRTKGILGGFLNVMSCRARTLNGNAVLAEIPSGIACDRRSSKPESHTESNSY